MSDDFDLSDLIEQGKRKERLEKQKSKPKPRETKTPEAIVLFVQIETCQTCGAVYEHPNPALLYRYKGQISRIDDWQHHWNEVPREIRHDHHKVPACQRCFEDADLGSEVVTKRE